MSSKSYNRPLTHQEYIQMKYLSQDDYGSKPVKKKKKAVNIRNSTVRIVDDDIDFRTLTKQDSDGEELYFGTKEEKPIIAGVVDDRPLILQAGTKWKRVGDGTELNDINVKTDVDGEGETAKGSSKSTAKTLSGKKAGLSNAREIRKELDELKRKNDKFMHALSDEVSGKNAKTVFRDRSTGRIRDMEKELAEKEKELHEKELKEAEKKATYDRWSKGLVQRNAEIEKLESDLHEMSKPLARYGDDSDLDKLLRDKDRLDDPMLQELRKKREDEEKARNPNYKVFPRYSGPAAPPNRFNIQPGHRWDGVDRSNGYEGKLFLRSSNIEASQEEAYRWSTQDM